VRRISWMTHLRASEPPDFFALHGQTVYGAYALPDASDAPRPPTRSLDSFTDVHTYEVVRVRIFPFEKVRGHVSTKRKVVNRNRAPVSGKGKIISRAREMQLSFMDQVSTDGRG
jgi:hypothetical protein